MKKDFISLADMTADELREMLELAGKIKASPGVFADSLAMKSFALVFEKPSTRTRVSFQVGISQLGGASFYLAPQDVGLGVREDVRDVARTLERYLNGVILRTYEHETIIEFARHSRMSVINGLSNRLHPCQALSDIFTMQEKKRDLASAKIAFVGDGNNVLHSLLFAVGKLGLALTVATPQKYRPDEEIVKEALGYASSSGAQIQFVTDPHQAARGADVLYTDVWVSMGQEAERERRLRDFAGFQVDRALLSLAKDTCCVMHCLPAHRNEEITDEVLEGPRSIVFDQAENRMHVQKAILLYLFK
ncbi:MAG: ornithine carbamoyltransferase [Candidatus Omnitrophica bacterium]|nr:ornithine carbamoyltransferase [Candidatus Omnitrophota bacterium]